MCPSTRILRVLGSPWPDLAVPAGGMAWWCSRPLHRGCFLLRESDQRGHHLCVRSPSVVHTVLNNVPRTIFYQDSSQSRKKHLGFLRFSVGLLPRVYEVYNVRDSADASTARCRSGAHDLSS